MKKAIVFIIGTAYLMGLLCLTLMPMAQASSPMHDNSRQHSFKNIQSAPVIENHHKQTRDDCGFCDASKQILQDVERRTVTGKTNLLGVNTLINKVFILLQEKEEAIANSLSPPISEFTYSPFELKSHKTIVLRR